MNSTVSATRALLDRIAADQSNAYVHLSPERSLEMAAESQRLMDTGQSRPLEGWHAGIKSLFCIKGLPTSASSRIMDGFVAPYTATAVQRLFGAGAILAGINNGDEFGMGSGTIYSVHGPCINPTSKHEHPTSPGGSSGGGAAAVAANLCRIALGSDTGGSCRQPAAWTGIVGFKPTYGLISRHGLIAHASSLDTVGIMARTAEDVAQVLSCIAGFDPYDAQTYDMPVPDYHALCTTPIDRTTCKIASLGFDTHIPWYSKVENFNITPLDISNIFEYCVEVYMIVSTAEAASNLGRYDGLRYGRPTTTVHTDLQDYYRKTRSEGFGPEVQRRILTGTYVLQGDGALFRRASQLRQTIADQMAKLWDTYDALILPTTTTGAMTIAEMQNAAPKDTYQSDRCTVLANLIGSPAISIPICKDHDGMPLGMQIVGPHFSEGKILALAREFSAAVGYR